jgi:glucose/arabinose dehydrogenase
MEQPVRYWVPSIGTSGLMIYSGDRFPNWKGNIFMGGMNGNQSLARLVMDGTRVVEEAKMLGANLRVRDVRQAPNGDIYLAIDDRGDAATSIVRFEPVN